MVSVLLVFYFLSLFLIFSFSVCQLFLTLAYKKHKKNRVVEDDKNSDIFIYTDSKEAPIVLVQLPIYNEKYVTNRIIDAVCGLEYPKDKLIVQVLDDSDDETVEIARQSVEKWRDKGFRISHIRRKNRTGYKAGALAYGMTLEKSDFIAIFDADFVPSPGFLTSTIPNFSDKEIGSVQTRWGHLNKDYSLITRMQAFGLDAHFTIEQIGRSASDSYINFNGTAGVWRTSSIIEAGGWSYDTLTEDLDLSYRAQLKDIKIKYLEEVETPAELPVLMTALKSQQYRWNKGAAENVRKNLLSVFKKRQLSILSKAVSFFHLTNSSIFILILIAAVVSVPATWVKYHYPEYKIVFYIANLCLLGFFSIGYFYYVSEMQLKKQSSFWSFIKDLFSFLTISLGLSFHNAVAVFEGLMGKKTPFIRTPKFNKTQHSDMLSKNVYIRKKVPISTFFEGFFIFYFLFGIYLQFKYSDFGLIIFHLMLLIGYCIVFFHTLKGLYYAKKNA